MESRFGSRRKASSMRPVLGAAAASFIIGGSLVGYYFWTGEEEEPAAAVAALDEVADPETIEDQLEADAPEPSPTAVASEAAEATEVAEEAAEAVERVAEQQGGLDQRLAAAEQRLARLDLQAEAAAGNAARAEGLLIAFATRRAVERGAELGYLADQLRLRFGDNWPNAVRTIIGFSRDPVRLDQLLARLDGLGPELSEREGINSWEDFRRELSDLFIVRRESTPSPQPERRLERARLALEQGRLDTAIGEVQNLPGAELAENWLADAQRYRDVMEALEVIETAAVLGQSGLRDATGNPVDQP